MPLSSIYFRSPLTDIFGGLSNNQVKSPCGNMEMRAVNCLEAYGEELAQTKCKDLLEDLYECMTRTKEINRVKEMLIERQKQVKAGERGYMEGPNHDTYEAPTRL